MCPRTCGRHKELRIRMTTRRENGVPGESRTLESAGVNAPRQKSQPIHAAEPLRAEHTYMHAGSYRFAICETAPYDESGCPAYARKRSRELIPAAAAPRTDPSLGSNGSGRPACGLLAGPHPPMPPTDDGPTHLSDK